MGPDYTECGQGRFLLPRTVSESPGPTLHTPSIKFDEQQEPPREKPQKRKAEKDNLLTEMWLYV